MIDFYSIKKPGSKISIVTRVPLVVVWPKAPNATTIKNDDGEERKIDQIDQIDQDRTFDDQKLKANNGDKTEKYPNQDAHSFESKTESRSNRSIRSISNDNGPRPEYEYLAETDAYRCNWCKCIYRADTMDTNAAHPCNFRRKGIPA